jgi:hypothetical protein
LTEISTGWGQKAGRKFTNLMAPKTSRGSNTYLGQSRLHTTLIKRDKEGHSILIKREIHQKKITTINLYTPNINAPNFIKHTLKDIKTYIDTNTVLVGNFKPPPSPTHRSSKQKNQ